MVILCTAHFDPVETYYYWLTQHINTMHQEVLLVELSPASVPFEKVHEFNLDILSAHPEIFLDEFLETKPAYHVLLNEKSHNQLLAVEPRVIKLRRSLHPP